MVASEEGRGTTIEVVFAADRHFTTPLAVAIHTLLVNLDPSSRAHVTVLSNRLSPRTIRRLRRLAVRSNSTARLTIMECGEHVRHDLPTPRRVTATAYFRLMIPDLISSSAGRVLYIDSDVIVRHDVTPLWNQDTGGVAVAAARDDGIKTVSAEKGLPVWRELGLDPQTAYFNTGVMLIDLDRWRELAIRSRSLRYLETHAESLVFADQDALNAVLAGDWQSLEERWNVTTGSYRRYNDIKHLQESEEYLRLRQVVLDPHIVHFTGPRKPWRYDCPHPLADVWRQSFKESAWWSGARYRIWYGLLRTLVVFHRARRRLAWSRLRPRGNFRRTQ